MNHGQTRLGPTIVSAVLLAGFSLFWFSDTIADPDLWGHVRFGQDILEAGSVVRSDVYSYRTAGQPWVNHEWLSEAIFAALYDRAGTVGLVGFKWLASALLLGLCLAHLRRHGLGPYQSVFLLLFLSVPFRLGLGTIRPQIFTYLLFLIELLLLERAANGGERWLWPLPVLFAAWVNLHGGVLAGVGVLVIEIAVRIVTGYRRGTDHRRSIVHHGLIAGACGGALVLNPYGTGMIRFLLQTATVPRPEIREWAPLGLMSLPGVFYLGLLVIGIVGLAASRRPRSPQAVAIFAAAAVLPLVSNRHYPLFALALVVLAGEHIADAANRWSPPSWAALGRRRAITAIGVLAGLVLAASSLPRFGCIRVEPFYFPFPARAVAVLKQSGVRGNMAVPFDWGEYVLWHLGPAIKVSIDGRRETLYSDEVYQQSRDFEHGTGAWDALLTDAKTDLVLASRGSPAANLMSLTRGWVRLYHDTACVVFVCAGVYDLEQFARLPIPDLPDDGNRLCFPVSGRLRHQSASPLRRN